MVEAVAAAVVTAMVSTGAAAAVAAARKASETRDAVLILTTKIEAIDARLALSTGALSQQDRRIQLLETASAQFDSRITALENGVIGSRHCSWLQAGRHVHSSMARNCSRSTRIVVGRLH